MNQLFGLQHRSRTDPMIPSGKKSGVTLGGSIICF